MSSLKRVFYSLNRVLSCWWAWLILLIGARRRGKTYQVKCWLLKGWKYKKIKFVILRYTEEECKKLSQDKGVRFWGDVLSKEKKFKDLEIEMTADSVYINGELAGYVMPVKMFHKFKGSQYEDCKRILFDEFIPEDLTRYSGDDALQFINMLLTIASYRNDIKVILTANALDCGNALLTDILNIRLKNGQFGLYKRKSKGAIVDYIPNSDEFIEHQKQGNVYKLIKGTRYEANLLNNEFVKDNDGLFYNKRKPCDLIGIYYGRDNVAVRVYQSKDGDDFYCGSDPNPNSANYMRFTFDLKLTTSKISLADNDEKKFLQDLYKNNLIKFQNEYILKVFKDIIR